MATTTKVFDYTGTVQFFTIPAGTTSVSLYLWGGAGGGGGGDGAGPGRSGAAGHYVEKTNLSLARLVPSFCCLGLGPNPPNIIICRSFEQDESLSVTK